MLFFIVGRLPLKKNLHITESPADDTVNQAAETQRGPGVAGRIVRGSIPNNERHNAEQIGR